MSLETACDAHQIKFAVVKNLVGLPVCAKVIEKRYNCTLADMLAPHYILCILRIQTGTIGLHSQVHINRSFTEHVSK